jgi:ribonuclease HII
MGPLPPSRKAQDGQLDTFKHERLLYAQGFVRVAGTDEAGRGPLAGPVVAACVVLPHDCNTAIFRDSKTLTHLRRTALYSELRAIGAEVGVGIVSARTIDRINILQSSLLAMKLALEDLVHHHLPPDFILVDGKFKMPHAIAQEALIKGDAKSASIAAASIVAKVQRDAMMDELHRAFPHYNFLQNKGYPTEAHRKAVARYGPCPQHRLTFRGVREFV